jgi:hypothetical protein
MNTLAQSRMAADFAGRAISARCAISSVDPSQPSQLEEQVAEVKPVIKSFEFHLPCHKI